MFEIIINCEGDAFTIIAEGINALINECQCIAKAQDEGINIVADWRSI
jgi:hypothetical protein